VVIQRRYGVYIPNALALVYVHDWLNMLAEEVKVANGHKEIELVCAWAYVSALPDFVNARVK
jgi:hypothetical protein